MLPKTNRNWINGPQRLSRTEPRRRDADPYGVRHEAAMHGRWRPISDCGISQFRVRVSPARCSKPVIAANRGYCFGVGFELSLACDFRIASETVFYALPEQKLGQIPGSGGSARLQKMVGVTRTKHIVMRSKRIPGKQALEWGFVTECVPDAELESATDHLVDELRGFSPLAQRTAKKLLNDTEIRC